MYMLSNIFLILIIQWRIWGISSQTIWYYRQSMNSYSLLVSFAKLKTLISYESSSQEMRKKKICMRQTKLERTSDALVRVERELSERKILIHLIYRTTFLTQRTRHVSAVCLDVDILEAYRTIFSNKSCVIRDQIPRGVFCWQNPYIDPCVVRYLRGKLFYRLA